MRTGTEAFFAAKVTGTENCHQVIVTLLGHDRSVDAAATNEKDRIRHVALPEKQTTCRVLRRAKLNAQPREGALGLETLSACAIAVPAAVKSTVVGCPAPRQMR